MAEFSEALEIYEKAYLQGQKDYNSHIGRGEKGHLAVLDDLLGQCDILAYIKQPTQEIPISRIVGTYTASRASSFSPDFLPLHRPRTEFANKWANLCRAHLNDGITDPITVYEYLWRYYVIEGNKRVSVLKYFGAVTVRAEVTRLIPRLDPDNPDSVRYHAYLDYAKKGLFPNLELSRAEDYEKHYRQEQRMLAALEPGTELNCPAMYSFFEHCYHNTGCTVPLGDTFAEYLYIYGFPTGISSEEVEQRIVRLQPQLDVIDMNTMPTLVLENEQEEQTPSLLQRLFQIRRRPHVVFAYAPGRVEGSWLEAHDQGRVAMEAALGDRITTSVIDGLTSENAYELLSQKASDADLLFVTNSSAVGPAVRFSLDHPDCLTLIYSSVRPDHRVHTYFGRYYEAIFLCGVAAGLYTHTKTVAYVTPHIASTRYTSDINAFLRGVRSVCRDARVILMTRGVIPGDDASGLAAVRSLAAEGCDVVLSPVYDGLGLDNLPENTFSALYSLNTDGSTGKYLASPGWNWEAFYLAITEGYLSGGLEAMRSYKRGDVPVTGFWWGLGSGVIDFHTSDWAPDATDNLIRYLRGSIRRNQYNPFHGPIRDLEGRERVPAHTNPEPLDIMDMDWFAEGLEIIE
ncbi:MAG: BMP family ABC transporter substrate-binding protein [Ruminococcaceae bacterium]|nr:BMP family ABC transporter substrate-binding protein [Oscillospiraceae bacterium]